MPRQRRGASLSVARRATRICWNTSFSACGGAEASSRCAGMSLPYGSAEQLPVIRSSLFVLLRSSRSFFLILFLIFSTGLVIISLSSMERYRRGHNENDSKSFDGQKPSVGSNPTRSANAVSSAQAAKQRCFAAFCN